MRSWRWWHKVTFISDHSLIAAGSLRNIPEPEHGASTSIISKKPVTLLKSRGSLLVTITFAVPQRLRLSHKTGTRVFMISLDTSRSSLFMAELINVLLPPGAAHRSKIFMGSLLSGLI